MLSGRWKRPKDDGRVLGTREDAVRHESSEFSTARSGAVKRNGCRRLWERVRVGREQKVVIVAQ